MQAKRFQEILQEVRTIDWTQVMNLLKAAFSLEYPGKEGAARVECKFRFNWDYSYPPSPVEALAPEEVLPLLESLPDEAILCLDGLYLYPEIHYGGGVFQVEASCEQVSCGRYKQYFSYRGDVEPHWQKLTLRIGGKKKVLKRSELYPGCTVFSNEEVTLKAYIVDSGGLTLIKADGSAAAQLSENREYFHQVFPGVEAMIEYDHREFPALWSWLHLDDYTEGGENPWYTRHHEKKEDLYEGRECIPYAGSIDKAIPQVTIVKIERRSLTLRVYGKDVDKEVVLDKPNLTEIIWSKGKRSLKAELYVTEPRIAKAWNYYGEQTPPAGCRAMTVLTQDGKEFTSTTDVRSLYCYLRPKEGSGGWNWPCVWGFYGGKMVLGKDSPSARSHFLGLLPEGETGTFRTDDNNSFKDDDDIIRSAVVSVRWQNVKMGFEVEDGELRSVPDAKEITVPEGVTDIYYEALLTAPSLERIIIPAAVTGFAYALKDYHYKRGRKLDVAFLGSLQDWFDRAYDLCGHIGRLFIGGKEQDFYQKKHLEIPPGITRIGKGLFEESEVLESVVIGPEVVSIGDSAFRDCEALCSVKILGPAEVGPSAFCSCGSLQDVYLADGVSALYDGCFDFVTTLKRLYIPASVKVAQCLSSQNDGGGIAPVFCCAAPSRPEGWWDTWNLAYYDPRFGFGYGHDHYHPVRWGAGREE